MISLNLLCLYALPRRGLNEVLRQGTCMALTPGTDRPRSLGQTPCASSSVTKTDDQAAEDPPAEGVWVYALHRGLDMIRGSGVSAPHGIVLGLHQGIVVAAPGAGSGSYRNLEESDPLPFWQKFI